MTQKQGPHEAGQSNSSDVSVAVDLWLRKSRFRAVGMVLDLSKPRLRGDVESKIQSTDALNLLKIMRATGASHAVLAGQLLRKRAGALVIGAQPEAVVPSVHVAVERMTELGESFSLWLIDVDDPVRAEVQEAIASTSAVEGHA